MFIKKFKLKILIFLHVKIKIIKKNKKLKI